MADSICYFPESPTKPQLDITKKQPPANSPDHKSEPLATDKPRAINYFPDLGKSSDEELAFDITDEDTQNAVQILRQDISRELVLNQAYIEAIAALENLSEDKRQLSVLIETIITETIVATVHQIKAAPETVQLESVDTPRLPDCFKHLSLPMLGSPAQPAPEVIFAKKRHLKLKKIGQILKETRQKKAISHSQLSQATNVLTRHIDALEEGKFDQLPEDLYVKGFIRHLGNALSLDGAALADTLPTSPDQMSAKVVTPNAEQRFATEAGRYVGYAALITGAVSGLSWSLHQSLPDSDPAQVISPTAPVIDQVTEDQATEIVQKSTKIAPPEVMKLPQ
ncbi:MAG: hypothetical protein HC799_12185 [Limnothrix sp. RL_2_0]|nr:hypothetical protein [Limnothrix sp. RL_2_0]